MSGNDTKTERRKHDEAEGYHISVGCVTAERGKIHMTDLIRDAETHMYQAKKQHYAEKGMIRDIR